MTTRIKISHCIYVIATVLVFTACQEAKPSGPESLTAIQHDEINLSSGRNISINNSAAKKVFYLFRHAEKDTVPKGNPVLTDEGTARGAYLAELFRKTRVDAVYSTMYMRTILTADSLVKAKGMTIKPYDPKELKAFAEQLLNDEKVNRAVIIGHSNTTPQLAGHLAQDKVTFESIDESEYNRMFIAVVDSTDASTVESLFYQVK